jgi:hypothetical protein
MAFLIIPFKIYVFCPPGREWGDPDGHPWIGLHGWLDNCGSLDKIASLFPKKGHRDDAID